MYFGALLPYIGGLQVVKRLPVQMGVLIGQVAHHFLSAVVNH